MTAIQAGDEEPFDILSNKLSNGDRIALWVAATTVVAAK